MDLPLPPAPTHLTPLMRNYTRLARKLELYFRIGLEFAKRGFELKFVMEEKIGIDNRNGVVLMTLMVVIPLNFQI